jgi:hypothetical protein
MKKVDAYISKNAPGKAGIWLQPVDGGYVLRVFDGGWKNLKLIDEGATSQLNDDKVQDLIGSVQDDRSANTINGAKATANYFAGQVLGTDGDTSSDMTLYGLKAYIDEQIAGLG